MKRLQALLKVERREVRRDKIRQGDAEDEQTCSSIKRCRHKVRVMDLDQTGSKSVIISVGLADGEGPLSLSESEGSILCGGGCRRRGSVSVALLNGDKALFDGTLRFAKLTSLLFAFSILPDKMFQRDHGKSLRNDDDGSYGL
ncbi:hypothetical protein Bca52824_038054 [Brassica carinata]|uniref:Uncharacterized protein n=1 Tax=Brassica carinata TaxID=52824 RepID=A0A8X7RR65_BRACI|nr:hypothetical protein Bca52824_038054 [Brassica carinata]